MWRSLALTLLVGACGSKQSPSRPPPHVPPPLDAGADSPARAIQDELPPDDVPADDDPPDEELACEDIIRDLATFPPALPDDTPERDWNLAIRAHVIEEDCEHGWTFEHKQCFATRGVSACAPQLTDLTERLAKLGELGAKIAAARAKPAAIGCKQVVAAHYGPPRWQGRLEGFSPKARNQMIADSRSLMQKACTAESWKDSTRACLVLGGGDLCFFATRIRRMWGYPADGSVRTLGIPDCDEYDAAVTKLAGCKNVEAYTRESLLRIAAALKANIAAAPPAERAKRAQSCRAALAPITDIVASSGC